MIETQLANALSLVSFAQKAHARRLKKSTLYIESSS